MLVGNGSLVLVEETSGFGDGEVDLAIEELFHNESDLRPKSLAFGEVRVFVDEEKHIMMFLGRS